MYQNTQYVLQYTVCTKIHNIYQIQNMYKNTKYLRKYKHVYQIAQYAPKYTICITILICLLMNVLS